MPRLSLETLSIVHAMLPQVEAQHAALTLRMWHHLSATPDREALFATFSGDDGPSMLQSFLHALRQRVRSRWPRLMPPPGLCEHHGPVLEDAFRRAFAEMSGGHNAVVLNAWAATFREFLAETCRPADPTGLDHARPGRTVA